MHRALRRAARVLVAGVALGLAHPALASPNSTLSAPTRQPARDAGPMALTPAQTRWVEIHVELAWLADDVTCHCPLTVRVLSGHLLVEGTAPSEAALARALQLAKQFGVLPLRDAVRIQLNPAEVTPAAAKGPLQEAAMNLLTRRMGPRAGSLELGALDAGHLFIGGSVTSFQEKLSISRLLKQVPGCKSVRNDLQVTVKPFEGRNYQRVTRDGQLAVEASTATASTVQPIRSTVQPELTQAPTLYSAKAGVSVPVRKTGDPVPAMLTTAPSGSLLTTPAVRKSGESAPTAPGMGVPGTPAVPPPVKTIAEPSQGPPITESSPAGGKGKPYPQWSTMDTWAGPPASESTPTVGKTSTAKTGKDDKATGPIVSTTFENSTTPSGSEPGTPRLEPVPEGAMASTREGPPQRPLRGLLTHLFPSGTPVGNVGTAGGGKVPGETTSVVLMTGQKNGEPVKVNHKPYVSNGVVYFDDVTAAPPPPMLGGSQTDLKKRLLAVTAGKARHVDVVVGDKITTIKVTVVTEAQEKEVREKILQFPELHSPNMCLETTVAPE